MKFCFKYKRKRICLDIDKCEGLNQGLGLMFKRRQRARALLFNFKRLTRQPIHSFFMSFPFIAIWLDEKNKVVETKIFRPFSLYQPKTKFRKMIEIPINSKYQKQVGLLVGI